MAQDEELQREVALKEIQGRCADDAPSRARFLLEARSPAGSSIRGSCRSTAWAPTPTAGRYYAMRFIRGDSLQGRHRASSTKPTTGRDPGKRTLELRNLLDRFIDVCNAIDYAHSRGVLHRDMKPANVMLGPYGETLVVDWGLAKAGRAVRRQSHDTGEATLRPDVGRRLGADAAGRLGTPAYMSPEQAAGRLDQLGPASDVYSLGATLYHLLTGQPPFEDKDIATILRQVAARRFPAAASGQAGRAGGARGGLPEGDGDGARGPLSPRRAPWPTTSSGGWPTSRSRPGASRSRFARGGGCGGTGRWSRDVAAACWLD